jgi:hypothetical protein
MPRLTSIGKNLVLLSALWAVGAGLYIFFSPQIIHGVKALSTAGEPQIVEEFTIEKSWYQVQGLWGTLILFILGAFYVVAVRLAWKGALPALAGLSVISLVLSYLTGFSIGGFYLPAAISLFVGMLLLVVARK